MYRLTAEYATYPKIHELREEIRVAMPGDRSRGAGSAPA
jgi:hypothetical protein